MAFKLKPAHLCDFYKTGHYNQYPKGTTQVFSNFTPRSSAHSSVPAHLREKYGDKVVFFGLQGFIEEFLIDLWNENFFHLPLKEVLTYYKKRMDNSLGPGVVGLDHIAELWELGYLPIEIRALPEGSRVPMRVPVFTVHSTLPQFYWVTNYLETLFSAELWKPSTTATISYFYRKLFEEYAEKTGADKGFVQWQGHDFSMRGMSGVHDAMVCGSGHLLSFTGTDTIPAVDYLEEMYSGEGLIGASVRASEHSVATFEGKEGEYEYFNRLLTEVYPSGIVSLVSDSFDYFQVLTKFLPMLKDKILAREGKCTIRPDSGNPVDIICGDEIVDYTEKFVDVSPEYLAAITKENVENKVRYETPHGELGQLEVAEVFKYRGKAYEVFISIDWGRYDKQYYFVEGSEVNYCKEITLSPQQKGSIELLWEVFGGTVNEKGYKVLDPHIGLIYGDSITLARAEEILRRLEAKGFASSNVVLGIGLTYGPFIL